MSENKEEYQARSGSLDWEGMTPEEWFQSREKPQARRSEEPGEYRVRIQNALDSFHERTKDKDPRIESYLSTVPENLREIARAFCEKFERQPASREKKFWLAEFGYQYEMGLTPEHIRGGFDSMMKEGLMIKSPASITAAADTFRLKDSATPKRKRNIIRVGDKDEKGRNN